MANAQRPNDPAFVRKGFFFGTGIGVSALQLREPGIPLQKETNLSFPNFKIGAMITLRTALLVYLPGSIYTSKSQGRTRQRGFEAILPSVQYWIANRWWVLGGVGIGMDAPAFYDIKSEEERTFYFGGSALASTGYEVWRRGKFACEVQGRVHFGTAKVDSGTQKGTAVSLLLGFNWY